MIEIFQAPFPANEVIYFDTERLSANLSFLEKNLCLASTEIVTINKKISCLVQIKADIKDIYLTLASFTKRFDSIDTTIFSHQLKFLDLEATLKAQERVI